MTTKQVFSVTSVHDLYAKNCLEKTVKALLTATGTLVKHNIKCMTIIELFSLTSVL